MRITVMVNNKTGETSEIDVDSVFFQSGEVANSQFARGVGIALDKEGYLIVDDSQRIDMKGIYTARDVTVGHAKQIGTTVEIAIIRATELLGYIR